MNSKCRKHTRLYQHAIGQTSPSICLWNVVFLHYVIIVKVKKFESVERECDDLDVGPHAVIVLLILTIAFRSPATIVFPLLPEPLRHSEAV